MSNKNLLLNGITDMLILHLLKQKDCYGYEITQAISELSDRLLTISQNTIYTAIYKLENDRMISEYSVLVGRKRTRVYYHITPMGEQYFSKLQANYSATIQGVQMIMERTICEKEGDSDESENPIDM